MVDRQVAYQGRGCCKGLTRPQLVDLGKECMAKLLPLLFVDKQPSSLGIIIVGKIIWVRFKNGWRPVEESK